MNGGSSIRGWRRDEGFGPSSAEAPLDLASEMLLDDPAGEPPARNTERSLIAPAIAITLALLWIAGALWLARGSLAGLSGPALAQFAAALTSVPGLIGIVWLLLQRTSRAEARRFGGTAMAMRAEAANLERSIATLSAVIDVNRVKLAEQTETLAAMGEEAAGRLARIGSGLSGEIASANRHAAALSSAARDAETALAELLARTPRAQAEVEEVAARLDSVAATALGHADALDAKLAGLGERGGEANRLAETAAARLAHHIEAMDATSETAGARLEAVTGAMATQVDGLLDRTARAMDEARSGIAAQGDAMLAMVRANQATLDQAARESAEALAARVEVIEIVIERIAARLGAQREAADGVVNGLEGGIAGAEARLEALHALGVDRSQHLAASISALGGSADAMTEALRAGEAMATRAIGTTESLLTALDSAAREIDETLPDALGRLDARIGASRRVVAQARPELLALVAAAESTHDAIEAIAQVVAAQRATLDQLSGALLQALASGRDKADALGAMVEATIGRANRFRDEAAPQLLDALLRVRDTAAAAADKAREAIAAVIPEAARQMEAASATAMTRAAGNSIDRQIASLAGAADAAVDAATRASERLGDRIQEIADNTALLDARLEAARAEREEADRDTFARRVSLLIEAMNSASIDLTRSFSAEVSDSAWAAYLKGDRGVFTRRAVRLLDAAEAREIVRLYDGDTAFREQVNRYIHDFEAMLRAILTQRDGSPLAVTLLSSDMGKLYVALAQAIERLR